MTQEVSLPFENQQNDNDNTEDPEAGQVGATPEVRFILEGEEIPEGFKIVDVIYVDPDDFFGDDQGDEEDNEIDDNELAKDADNRLSGTEDNKG